MVVGQGFTAAPRRDRRPEDAVGSQCHCQTPLDSRYRGAVVRRNPPPARHPLPSLAPCGTFGARSPRQQDPAGAGAPSRHCRFSRVAVPELFVPAGSAGGSGPAVPHAAAVERLQQKRELLRVYQDTAACRSVWGYCGKSQPPNRAGRVLEAPAETEHQQLLAQTCLCASHLAKMETELSPGFVSHIPKHNAAPAALVLAVALELGAMQHQRCRVLGRDPLCQNQLCGTQGCWGCRGAAMEGDARWDRRPE